MFDEVTNRRRDILETLTPGRLAVVLYLAAGLGGVFRHDPYGWLVLSVLSLAALASFVRQRFPDRSRTTDSVFFAGASAAVIAYGVLVVLRHDNFGWIYAVTGVAGLVYVSVRRPRSVGQVNR